MMPRGVKKVGISMKGYERELNHPAHEKWGRLKVSVSSQGERADARIADTSRPTTNAADRIVVR
jgi:hypothetical protein